MLCDIKFKEPPKHPGLISQSCDLSNGGIEITTQYSNLDKPETLRVCYRIAPGIYYSWVLRAMLSAVSNYQECCSYERWPWGHFGKKADFGMRSPPPYGSADNLKQIYRRCRKYWQEPNRHFILTIHWITKKDDPDWRWHKNGPYLGIQKPKCEHIGEEPRIDSVLSFEFLEIELKAGATKP